jgi:uncharacterized membrane protein YjjB (DUF3815 family)
MINLSAVFSVSNLVQVFAIAALGYIIQQQYGQPSQPQRSAAAAAAAAAASQGSNSRSGKGPALSKKKGGKGAKGSASTSAAAAAPDSRGGGQPAAAAATEEEVCSWCQIHFCFYVVQETVVTAATACLQCTCYEPAAAWWTDAFAGCGGQIRVQLKRLACMHSNSM